MAIELVLQQTEVISEQWGEGRSGQQDGSARRDSRDGDFRSATKKPGKAGLDQMA